MKKLLLLALFASLFFLTAEPPLAADQAARQLKRDRAANQAGQVFAPAQLTAGSLSYLVLPPAAFTNDGSAPAAYYIDPDYGYLHGVDTVTNMWAPVNLPSGTAISSLEVFLEDWDTEPGHDVCIYLDRMDLATGEYECCLAEICSTGAGEDYVALIDDTIIAAEVSDRYAYQVNIFGLYPETYIYGVRVGYGNFGYLPSIIRESP